MSVADFREAIRAAGMTPPDAIEPGRWYRFPGASKAKGNSAGWCKLFPDGMAGAFGDYSRDVSEIWQAKRSRPISVAEREGFRQQVERARADAAADREREQTEAANNAAQLWARGMPATEHDYLAAKGVKPNGARIADGNLLIPMRDAAGTLWNVQRIPPDGIRKRFLHGGRVTGCYYSIGKPNGVIAVAEGFATGASIHECTGHAVAVAFNAGNLKAVAGELRTKFPDARITLCADDDYATEGNPGIAKATEAARSMSGLVAVPDFGMERTEGATDFNDLHQLHGADAVKRAIAEAKAPDVYEAQASADEGSGGASWPPPQPLVADGEPPPYPLAALPDGIREAVAEVVAFVQCPPALAACSALSALSLAAQGLADVQRCDGLTGPTSLYLLAIAESGERKTTCDREFLDGLREWEREQESAIAPEIARHRANLAAWEQRCEGIKARIKQKAKEGKPTETDEAELMREEFERPQALRVPRLIHADSTPEALAWNLASGWPSAGVMSSEAGIVFGGHGMNRESAMRNLSLLNSLWDGASHRIDRRAEGQSFKLVGARLTMGLAAQPQTVRQFMEQTKGLARGNGFAARFLLAAPASTQGWRLFKPGGSRAASSAFGARLRALLSVPTNRDDQGALAPPLLEFVPEAFESWRRFHDDVEREQRTGGEMADVRDVASKAADNVARLAALFHLFRHGPPGRIGADCVNAAADIVTWHLYQARTFLDGVAASPEVSNARRLDDWLIAKCCELATDRLPLRTAQRLGPNPIRDRRNLDAALVVLAEADRAPRIEQGRTTLIAVNPTLLAAKL